MTACRTLVGFPSRLEDTGKCFTTPLAWTMGSAMGVTSSNKGWKQAARWLPWAAEGGIGLAALLGHIGAAGGANMQEVGGSNRAGGLPGMVSTGYPGGVLPGMEAMRARL